VGRRTVGQQEHIRRAETVLGLRVWLALRAAHVRLNEARYERHD